jgi:hypothetical protein
MGKVRSDFVASTFFAKKKAVKQSLTEPKRDKNNSKFWKKFFFF